MLAQSPLFGFYADMPINLDGQISDDGKIIPRTPDDFRRDFKALYGVEEPKDLPCLALSDGSLITPAAAAEIAKNDVLEELPFLIQAARTGNPHMAYRVGQMLRQQLRNGLKDARTSFAAALWLEYAALSGTVPIAGEILSAGFYLPPHISFAWKTQYCTPEMLHRDILNFIKHNQIVLTDRIMIVLNTIPDYLGRISVVSDAMKALLHRKELDQALLLATSLSERAITDIGDLADLCLECQNYQKAFFYYSTLLNRIKTDSHRINWFRKISPNLALLRACSELTSEQQAHLDALLTGPFSQVSMEKSLEADQRECDQRLANFYLEILRAHQSNPIRLMFDEDLSFRRLEEIHKIQKSQYLTEVQYKELLDLFNGPFSIQALERSWLDDSGQLIDSLITAIKQSTTKQLSHDAFRTRLFGPLISLNPEQQRALEILAEAPFGEKFIDMCWSAYQRLSNENSLCTKFARLGRE